MICHRSRFPCDCSQHEKMCFLISLFQSFYFFCLNSLLPEVSASCILYCTVAYDLSSGASRTFSIFLQMYSTFFMDSCLILVPLPASLFCSLVFHLNHLNFDDQDSLLVQMEIVSSLYCLFLPPICGFFISEGFSMKFEPRHPPPPNHQLCLICTS